MITESLKEMFEEISFKSGISLLKITRFMGANRLYQPIYRELTGRAPMNLTALCEVCNRFGITISLQIKGKEVERFEEAETEKLLKVFNSLLKRNDCSLDICQMRSLTAYRLDNVLQSLDAKLVFERDIDSLLEIIENKDDKEAEARAQVRTAVVKIACARLKLLVSSGRKLSEIAYDSGVSVDTVGSLLKGYVGYCLFSEVDKLFGYLGVGIVVVIPAMKMLAKTDDEGFVSPVFAKEVFANKLGDGITYRDVCNLASREGKLLAAISLNKFDITKELKDE